MGVVSPNNVPISDIRVAGGAKARMMIAGTGSDVVEVWPYPNYQVVDLLFGIPQDLGAVPIGVFDGRTHVDSQKYTVNSSGGNLTTLVNNVDTYHTRLVNRKFNGHHMTMEFSVGNPVESLARPSAIILASSLDGQRTVGVAVGNNGVRLYHLNGTSFLFDKIAALAIAPFAVIKVVRIDDNVQVFVNGTQVLNETSQFFDSWNRANLTDFWYPGFSVYAGAGSVTSTSLKPIAIRGTTDQPELLLSTEQLRCNVELPRNTWVEVARGYVAKGGLCKFTLDSVRFKNDTAFSTREFYMKLNNVDKASVTNQNGGSVTVNNITVPDNSIITVTAYSGASNAQDRFVQRGRYVVEKM